MTADEDHEATIIIAVLAQVDEALHAAETRSLGILILMSPRRVLRKIFSVWQRNIDGIVAADKILCSVQLGEHIDNRWLAPHRPGEGLIDGCIRHKIKVFCTELTS